MSYNKDGTARVPGDSSSAGPSGQEGLYVLLAATGTLSDTTPEVLTWNLSNASAGVEQLDADTSTFRLPNGKYILDFELELATDGAVSQANMIVVDAFDTDESISIRDATVLMTAATPSPPGFAGAVYNVKLNLAINDAAKNIRFRVSLLQALVAGTPTLSANSAMRVIKIA